MFRLRAFLLKMLLICVYYVVCVCLARFYYACFCLHASTMHAERFAGFSMRFAHLLNGEAFDLDNLHTRRIEYMEIL